MSSRNKRRNKSRNKSRSQRQRQDHERAGGDGGGHGGESGSGPDRATRPARPSTETKRSTRTTELAVYAAAVLAVVMASLAVDADGEGGGDPFGAERAIRYITVLTIGYMLARGLAKAGSHRRAGLRRTDAHHDELAVTDVADDDLADVDAAGTTDRDPTSHVARTTVAGPRQLAELEAHDDGPQRGHDDDAVDDSDGSIGSDGSADPEGEEPEGQLRLHKLEPRQ